MKLTCNIDQRGRMARLIAGALVDLCGSGLLITGMVRSDMRFVVAGVVMSVAGAFMIFEGAAGWCAARAMGFKTRI